MSAAAVAAAQRFSPSRPCPICGGHPLLPSGRGARCFGFLSDDGQFAHCTREELAGPLPLDGGATYAHRVAGPCRCGATHTDAPDPSRAARAKVVREARHVLRDADGAPLFVHRRAYDAAGAKRVWWERPDGTNGLGGAKVVDLPLYGVHELNGARSVVLAEGEPARDALAGLGIPALATVCGAKAVPGDAALRPLLNLQVVGVWPDNDSDGRAHMAKLAARLRALGHPDIRLVDWADAPPKADAADFVAAGGTADDVRRLLGQAKPFQAEELAILAKEASPKEEAADSAYSHVHDEQKPEPKRPALNLTDVGNGERLAAQHGEDIRYSHVWNRWLIWDGARLAPDEVGGIVARAKQTVRSIYGEAEQETDDKQRAAIVKHARESERAQRISALVSLAQSEPGIPVRADQLDRDPFLFNCSNGTINLRTGKLQPHRRDDLITKVAPVGFDPGAACPIFERFIARIMGDDPELIQFIQRALGYSLTAETNERVIFILYGAGKNGKSTLIEVFRAITGDYSLRTPTDTLLAKRDAGIPNDIARLNGVRFVSASEAEEGQRFAEAKLKDLTGGDMISARFMRGEFFDFMPTFKLWLATNHKPLIRGSDQAIFDRIRTIPFEVRIPPEEQDKHLRAKLIAEASGILAWAVRGCLDWQRHGLGEPMKVLAANAVYRAEMDIVGAFIEDRCMEAEHAHVSARDLFKAYVAWCEESGEKPLTQTMMGKRLTERGYDSTRVGKDRTRTWLGIALRECAGDDPDGGRVYGGRTRMDADSDITESDGFSGGLSGKTRSNASAYANASANNDEQVF